MIPFPFRFRTYDRYITGIAHLYKSVPTHSVPHFVPGLFTHHIRHSLFSSSESPLSPLLTLGTKCTSPSLFPLHQNSLYSPFIKKSCLYLPASRPPPFFSATPCTFVTRPYPTHHSHLLKALRPHSPVETPKTLPPLTHAVPYSTRECVLTSLCFELPTVSTVTFLGSIFSLLGPHQGGKLNLPRRQLPIQHLVL
jgi:hypothetical protein